jgi:hypothetical protein
MDDFVAAREREGGKLAEVIGERATRSPRSPPRCARWCR